VSGGELVGVDVEALVARADRIAEAMLARAEKETGRNYRRR
jgi:hypothetical protein